MLSNTAGSYGTLARMLHWLTALLILALIPTGIIANGLPAESSEELLAKARLFSVHKTLGVTLFAVALLRIVWAIVQPRPTDLHPERLWETFAARTVHWLLYGSLVLVPATGWVAHAATAGFAPILWPLGQDLPFVPKSNTLYHSAAGLHIVFQRVLVLALALHVAGALKHHFWDRDATLRRMLTRHAAPTPDTPPTARRRIALAPVGMALALWAIALGTGVGLGLLTHSPTVATIAPQRAETIGSTGNWSVESGSLAIVIRQLGQEVQGTFARWSADITFDRNPHALDPGHVIVVIDISSLTLGQVTPQALGTGFLDAANFPKAVFEAQIIPMVDRTYLAEGQLTIKDAVVPTTLEFQLGLAGDMARVTGRAALDRRDFFIGMQMGDETTLGFAVDVVIDLTARETAD